MSESLIVTAAKVFLILLFAKLWFTVAEIQGKMCSYTRSILYHREILEQLKDEKEQLKKIRKYY